MSTRILALALVFAAALLSACSVIDHAPGEALPRDAKWALLPIANHTDVPQAGLRAESIAETLLRARGVTSLARYPAALNPETVFDPAERRVQADAQKWARETGARYALTGAVDEWRYKVGVDGEPAVGLVLQIIDLKDGSVAWSSVGARSGWSREALSAVAQKLIRDLLASARIE